MLVADGRCRILDAIGTAIPATLDLVTDRSSSPLAFPLVCGLLASVYFGLLGVSLGGEDVATTTEDGEQVPHWYASVVGLYVVCAIGTLSATSAYAGIRLKLLGIILCIVSTAFFAGFLRRFDFEENSSATVVAQISALVVMCLATLLTAVDASLWCCWRREPWAGEVGYLKECKEHVSMLLASRHGSKSDRSGGDDIYAVLAASRAGALSVALSPKATGSETSAPVTAATGAAAGSVGMAVSPADAGKSRPPGAGLEPSTAERKQGCCGEDGCCFSALSCIVREFDCRLPRSVRYPQRILACVFSGMLATILAFVVFRDATAGIVGAVGTVVQQVQLVQETLRLATENAKVAITAISGSEILSSEACANASSAVQLAVDDPSARNPLTEGMPAPLNMTTCVPATDPGAPIGLYPIHCACGILQSTEGLVNALDSATAPGGGLEVVFDQAEIIRHTLSNALDIGSALVLACLLLHWLHILPQYKRMLLALRSGSGLSGTATGEALQERDLVRQLTRQRAETTGVGLVPGRFAWRTATSAGFKELHLTAAWYVNDLSVNLVTQTVYNSLFSTLLLTTVAALLIFLVTWTPTLILLLQLLPVLATSLAVMAGNMLLRYCVIRPFVESGVHLARPRCFGIFEMLMIGSQAFSGVLVAVTRVCLGIVGLLVVFVRPDMQLFPSGTVFDSVHAPFMAALLADHRHNNPIVRIFCEDVVPACMQDAMAAKRAAGAIRNAQAKAVEGAAAAAAEDGSATGSQGDFAPEPLAELPKWAHRPSEWAQGSEPSWYGHTELFGMRCKRTKGAEVQAASSRGSGGVKTGGTGAGAGVQVAPRSGAPPGDASAPASDEELAGLHASVASARRRRVAFRWQLAYTLLRNSSIRRWRKDSVLRHRPTDDDAEKGTRAPVMAPVTPPEAARATEP
jgi:hypothetical protein